MLVEKTLFKAIKYYGNKQIKLAQAIGENPDKIRYWLNRHGRIPFHNAIAIELATNGYVSRYDLAPYARCKHNLKNYQTQKISISEQVSIGVAFEESILRKNFNAFKGRTDVITAKLAGFGNHVSYRQAKKVVSQGIFKLVQAMDDRFISISTAAVIATLTPEQQEEIIQLNKKEIIDIVKKIKGLIYEK